MSEVVSQIRLPEGSGPVSSNGIHSDRLHRQLNEFRSTTTVKLTHYPPEIRPGRIVPFDRLAVEPVRPDRRSALQTFFKSAILEP